MELTLAEGSRVVWGIRRFLTEPPLGFFLFVRRGPWTASLQDTSQFAGSLIPSEAWGLGSPSWISIEELIAMMWIINAIH
jgi:hypothetical protein